MGPGVGMMINDKIRDYTPMNEVSYFSPSCFIFSLYENASSNKQTEESDVIKAKNLDITGVTLNKNEAIPILSLLLNHC